MIFIIPLYCEVRAEVHGRSSGAVAAAEGRGQDSGMIFTKPHYFEVRAEVHRRVPGAVAAAGV